MQLYLSHRDKEKTNLFSDESLFPTVQTRKQEIKDIEKEMLDHRRTVRLILKQPALDFTTVLGTEVSVNNLAIKDTSYKQQHDYMLFMKAFLCSLSITHRVNFTI